MLKYVRFFLLPLWFVLVSLLCLPLLLLRPFHRNNAALVMRLCAFGGIPLLGVEVEYENIERCKDIHSSVIISNHQDSLDIFTLGKAAPDSTVAIGKKQLIYIPVFGFIYWICGNLFIDRSDRKRAFASLERAKQAMVEEGKNIWIMPEGTRSRGDTRSFKKGAFYMAIHAQVPVWPIVIGDYRRLNFNAWRAGKLKISVLDPMPTAGLTDKDIPRLRDMAFEKVQQKFSE